MAPQPFAAQGALVAGAVWRWGAGRSAALLVALTAGVFAYINYLFWLHTRYELWLLGDSTAYLAWHGLRTPGYPAFIHLAHFLTGDLRWLVPLQLNLLLLSFAALAIGFGRLTGSRLAGLAALLLLCGCMSILKTAAMLLTEALVIALVCLHLAALCCHLQRAGWRSAACIGGTIALIYMARPSVLPLVAASLLLLFIPAQQHLPPPPPQNQGYSKASALAAACAPGRWLGAACRPGADGRPQQVRLAPQGVHRAEP